MLKKKKNSASKKVATAHKLKVFFRHMKIAATGHVEKLRCDTVLIVPTVCSMLQQHNSAAITCY